MKLFKEEEKKKNYHAINAKSQSSLCCACQVRQWAPSVPLQPLPHCLVSLSITLQKVT